MKHHVAILKGVFYLSAVAETFEKQLAERKPNFIVILADDLGFGDMGCYGAVVRANNEY